MSTESNLPPVPVPELSDSSIVGDQHRVDQTEFLVAQTVSKPSEILRLWKQSFEQARKAPLFRSRSKAGKNLGSVVDQPLQKIRSIRFEQDDEADAALHPRGQPTPIRRRRTAATSRKTTSQSRAGQEGYEMDDLDGLPDDFEEDDDYSLHRPLSRMHSTLR